MRLIDADAFGMYLADVQLSNRGVKDELCEFLDDVMDALDESPTVDAVVLPCKVGDAVYMENGDDETPHFVDSGKVFAIGIDESGTMWISVRYESGLKYYHTSDDIGKTVFLTREEAEAALEERMKKDA